MKSLNTKNGTNTADQNLRMLLKYTIYNKLPVLKLLLEKQVCDLNYIFSSPFEKTIVEIACCDYAFKTEPECLKLLLQHGASPHIALKSAVFGGNPELLKIILNHLVTNLQYSIKNSTIILDLLHNMNEEVEEVFYAKCVKLLLKYGVNVNNTEKYTKCTGVYLAAKNNYEHILKELIENSFDEIDLDTYKENYFGSARDIIIMNKLYLKPLPKPIENKNYFFLEKYLDSGDEYRFITEYDNLKFSENIKDTYGQELFIYAIKKGLINVVKYLLCSGIDINSYELSASNSYPLFIACKIGYYKIVKILLAYSHSEYISEALITMLKTVQFHENCLDALQINHKKCFDMLIDDPLLDINYTEKKSGKSLLYYAIKHQPASIILRILQKGASLAHLTLQDSSWISCLLPEVLITHFDSCIKVENVKTVISNTTTLSINFSTLFSEQDMEDIEFDKSNKESLELDKRHSRHQKKESIIESKVLEFMSNHSEYYTVLQHPLIHIFMFLKWQELRIFFYSSLAFYLIYGLSLITYLVLPFFYDYKILLSIFFYLITFGLIILVLREIIQMFMIRLDYFKNKENLLDLGMLIMTIILLCIENENSAIFNQLSAIVIILSTMELLAILGKHFEILFTSITILITVSKTLIKFILPFFILILAFSFSFFILFQKQEPVDTSNDTSLNKENMFFSHPGLSLFKTTLMLTGEFEAGEIDFTSYPITSPILFILFVFFMNIVLFGVFTALAINDIQQVKEIQNQIMKIKDINYMDKLLIDILPKKWKRRIQTPQQIEIDLKNSKLYFKDQKTIIKVNQKVINSLKKLVEKYNNILPDCNLMKCPALRHTTTRKSLKKRFTILKDTQINSEDV